MFDINNVQSFCRYLPTHYTQEYVYIVAIPTSQCNRLGTNLTGMFLPISMIKLMNLNFLFF